MKNISIFASGYGSNFIAIDKAIKRGKLKANISLVVSDNPNSKAIIKAKELGYETFVFDPKKFKTKDEYERQIVNTLKPLHVEMIVLAGYMRLIGERLLGEYEKRIINIHPSLLPNYKGLNAIKQAYDDKAFKTGVTIHYVDSGLDSGEIIAQKSFLITKSMSLEEMETKVHKIEHKLYPKTIQKLLKEI